MSVYQRAAERAAERLPETLKPAVRSVAHLLAPQMSWQQHRRVGATRERFVDRFFESEAAFEAYESEFFESRIVDVCRSASERVDDDDSIYDAHMDECVRLYALVREYRPRTLVETGVYHGVATTSLLLALAENGEGRLYSIDASPLLTEGGRTGREDDGDADGGDDTILHERVPYYERGRPSCAEAGTHRLPDDCEPGWIVPEDLQDRWELTVGRSQRELPALLEAVGPVDLFVHDSEHSIAAMFFEFELAWEHLRPGGMVVSFHVDRNRAFETFAAERPCEHGRLTYTYNGFEDYESACSSGYLLDRTGPLFGGRADGVRGDGTDGGAGDEDDRGAGAGGETGVGGENVAESGGEPPAADPEAGGGVDADGVTVGPGTEP